MIILDLQTKTGRSLILLDNLCAIEYDEASGELQFVGDNTIKPVYLDKKTPAKEVWDTIGKAIYQQASRAVIDVKPFQKEEPTF